MSNLDNLMNLQGATAAFEYSDSGELMDHRIAENSGFQPDSLDLLSHVFVANTAIATMQARGWEKSTGQGGFYPIEGFTLIGLEWSAIGKGNRGVIVSNDEVDYEAAYAALAD